MAVAQQVDLPAGGIETAQATVDTNPEIAVAVLVESPDTIRIGCCRAVARIHRRDVFTEIATNTAPVDAIGTVMESSQPDPVLPIAVKADAEFVAQLGIGHRNPARAGIVTQQSLDRTEQDPPVGLLDQTLHTLVGHPHSVQRGIVDGLQAENIPMPIENTFGEGGDPNPVVRIDVDLRDVGIVVDPTAIGQFEVREITGFERRGVENRDPRFGGADPKAVIPIDSDRGIDILGSQRDRMNAFDTFRRSMVTHQVAVKKHPQIAIRGHNHLHTTRQGRRHGNDAPVKRRKTLQRGVVTGQRAIEREHPDPTPGSDNDQRTTQVLGAIHRTGLDGGVLTAPQRPIVSDDPIIAIGHPEKGFDDNISDFKWQKHRPGIVFKLSGSKIKTPGLIPVRKPKKVIVIIKQTIQSGILLIGDANRMERIALARRSVVEIQHRGGLDAHQSIGQHEHVADVVVGESAVTVNLPEKAGP